MKPVKGRLAIAALNTPGGIAVEVTLEDDAGRAVIEFPPFVLPEGGLLLLGPVYIVPGLMGRADVTPTQGVDPANVTLREGY